MGKSVFSQMFYDNERSRLTLGVTGTGTPYAQLARIFDDFIGATDVKKGEKMYNNEDTIFMPLNPVEVVKFLNNVQDFLDGGLEEIGIYYSARSMVLTDLGDEDMFLIMQDDKENLIEHLLTIDEFNVLHEFIKLSLAVSFRFYEAAQNDENTGNQGGNTSKRSSNSRSNSSSSSRRGNNTSRRSNLTSRSGNTKATRVSAEEVEDLLGAD